MRPPRYFHDILQSIENDPPNPPRPPIEVVSRRPRVINNENPIEVVIAMESQTFEINRAQCAIYLRKWGRLQQVEYNWHGIVMILHQMATDFERYKEMVTEQTGRCFRLKCDIIREALVEIAEEVRWDRKIRYRSEWKMDMLYRCIGRLTLYGYDDLDEYNIRRPVRNCEAVERALQDQLEADWRVKDIVHMKIQYWRRIYFSLPNCTCQQCAKDNTHSGIR